MITVHNGDCMEVMRNMPDRSIDLVLTDIPYGVINRDGGLRNMDKGAADIVTFGLLEMVDEVCRLCSGSIYMFCSTEQVSDIRTRFIHNGLSTRLCIWEKTNPSPVNGQYMWLSGIECIVFGKRKGGVFHEHCKNSVFKYPSCRSKIHPTQKPVKLLEYLINTSSNEGDTVLDCFMGSGSTGIACLNTKRNFIGIELNKQWYDAATDRLDAEQRLLYNTESV